VSHKGLRKLLQDTAQSLGDDLLVTYGKDTDFNQMRDKRYKAINISPLQASAEYAVDGVQNYSKTWSVSIAFYDLDNEASIPEQYSKILDETDHLVDSFINKLNFYSLQADTILISGISQTPFIKAMADILTGHILTFTVQLTDDFNYCELGDC
jgi:hypothetical protein